MALSIYSTQTTSILGGTRYASKNENTDTLLANGGLGKPRLRSGTARLALGNISNNSTSVAFPEHKKTQHDACFIKPRPVPKSTATSSLKAILKENVTKTEDAVKDQIELQVSRVSHEIVAEQKGNLPMEHGLAFSKLLLPAHVADVDKEDSDHPHLVSEYVNDIYDYLRHLERQFAIKPQYLGLVITGRMRSVLMDWIVQVHLRFHLLQETLYLTVAIIDRFLQLQDVSRNKLQLVGVTAMLVASKYEEIYAPEINDFLYITDNAYQKQDICAMERFILRTLNFNLGRPLPLHFLRRNSKAGEVDAINHTLAKYLMELTITDYDMVHIHPSEIAAASLCLSMKVLDSSDWSDTLLYYSRYSETELRPIIQKIATLVTRAGTGKLTAIKRKYSSSKFMRIALTPELKSQVLIDLAESADH